MTGARRSAPQRERGERPEQEFLITAKSGASTRGNKVEIVDGMLRVTQVDGRTIQVYRQVPVEDVASVAVVYA